jgi:adhesin transport system membrane fusion protein
MQTDMNEQTPENNEQPKSPGIFRRMPAADVDLATDIRTTLLIQSPRGGRYIVWLTGLFFLLFIVWSALSKIDEVTRGNGKVIPSQQIQVVQNLEGGILSKLHIHVGDIVEKDQLLLEIDKTRFSAPYMESRVSSLALKAQIARLEAETHNTPFTVPAEVVKEKPELGLREQQLYTSRKEQLAAKVQILQEQQNQRQQELAELRSKLVELTRTSGLLQRELGMTKPLIAQGAVSEVEVLRLQRQASEMNGNIEATKISIPKVESKITEAKKAMEEAQLTFHNTARGELNEAYAKLEGINANSTALMDRLQRTEVRSPVRGTINQIKVNTAGGTIQPGMDLIEIVPLEDTLLVEARIKPADIAFLRPNQQAMIKFTAYDFTVYGGLDAALEHISADSITEKQGEKQGEDFYLVRLRTKQNYLGIKEIPLPIIPGMVVSVDILTGKKTILSYLLKPVLRAKHTALRER